MIVANEKGLKIRASIQNEIILVLSMEIRQIIRKLPAIFLESVEEIRLKSGQPLMLYDSHTGWFVSKGGKLKRDKVGAYRVTQEDINRTLELMSNNSIYAIQDELKNGYITITGGHRVGVAGKVILNNGVVSFIKDIASMNIRVSKQIIGAADSIIENVVDEHGTIYNTLIISPPQCGKTTMLRDIARQLSDRIHKVAIVDERSEIAGCYKGIPQNDVGLRTDVLDACPKAHGMMMMIRSMSPDVIITDEIGMAEDIAALRQVLNAGVKIITSVHGYSRQDIIKRPILGKLLKEQMFERVVVLSKSKGTGTIEEVWKVEG